MYEIVKLYQQINNCNVQDCVFFEVSGQNISRLSTLLQPQVAQTGSECLVNFEFTTSCKFEDFIWEIIVIGTWVINFIKFALNLT